MHTNLQSSTPLDTDMAATLENIKHTTNVQVSEGKVPESKRLRQLFSQAGHGQFAELNRLIRVGPVVVTLDSTLFDSRCQHRDERRLLFPDHEPEVAGGFRKGALSGNIAIDYSGPGNFHLRETKEKTKLLKIRPNYLKPTAK